MENTQLEGLYHRYVNNEATGAEVDELLRLIEDPANREQLMQLFDSTWDELKIPLGSMPVKNLPAPVVLMKPRRRFWIRAVAAAAVIILLLGAGYLFLVNKKQEKPVAKTEQQRFKNDINPGRYKAKLTLTNGSTIILDSARAGELTKQGSVSVSNKDGQLVYRGETANLPTGKAGVKSEILYNTLSTARGETYATTLSDGSKVWLNSESSIKFPVMFVAGERKVEITGEAYFEVAHDAAKPFKASVNGVEVQVLGTHFNISAYNDEPVMRTTLLEGSVKLTTGSGQVAILKPGEQALRQAQGDIKVSKDVDLDEVMAWKNGQFYFSRTDIKTIMRQVSRWYDVNVNYESEITEKFGGAIPRSVTISKLLQMLELTGHVHFKIEGKNVTVMK